MKEPTRLIAKDLQMQGVNQKVALDLLSNHSHRPSVQSPRAEDYNHHRTLKADNLETLSSPRKDGV